MTYIEAQLGYQAQKQEEQASRYLETHRIPDPYYFDIKDGKIVSPNTGIPIESPKIIDTSTALGRDELEAFKKIQDFANKNDSGYAIWISPPYQGVYPVSKIVISEIIKDREVKKLLNRAIITRWDTIGSIIAAQELSILSEKKDRFENTISVRRIPIFISSDFQSELFLILENIIDKHSMEMIKDGLDFREKEAVIKRYKSGESVVLGKFQESCPSAFRVFSGETFNCPKCLKEIPSGRGIVTCPHCGMRKTDLAVQCA